MDKKQEELEKMYALRAGLSLISQKCDEVANEESKIKAKTENAESLQNNILNVDLNCGLQEAKENVKKTKAEGRQHTLLMTLISIPALPLLPFIVGYSIYGAHVSNKMALLEVEECKQKIEENLEKKNQLIGQLEEANAELNTLKTDYFGLLDTINCECQEIQDLMSKEFGKIIDIRDWENLDLVIYYYETGRADSIKEALQLVDKERRNNALIEAIGIATNEICRSIQSVGKAMIEGFNLLSSQLSEISSNQVLTNALLAKANLSSKQMVEQMQSIKNKIKSS